MTHQFALKQDVRTPHGDGFVEFIGDEWISVAIGADSYNFRSSQLIPLEPVRGQEIEVRTHNAGSWRRAKFIGFHDDLVIVHERGDITPYKQWRFIPEPKPSSFTAEQLAELDKRYARKEAT